MLFLVFEIKSGKILRYEVGNESSALDKRDSQQLVISHMSSQQN